MSNDKTRSVLDENATASILNATTGHGVPGKDPRIGGYFTFGPQMNYAEASAMYSSMWVAKKIVDIPVDDELRGWRECHCPEIDPEKVQEVETLEKKLGIKKAIERCRKWARLFGGSVMLLGVNDGGKDLSEPLDIESLKEGALEFVQPLDMWQVGVEDININEPYAPDYWEPHYYNVYGHRVHKSRLIKFIGEEVPYQIAGYYNYFGISVLQPSYEQIRDVGMSLAGAATMILRGNQDIVKTKQLWDYVGTENESKIKARFTLMELQRSIMNMLVLDSEEDFASVPATFSGLEGVLSTMLQMTTGAADIPATRFFGQSPQGFNATGESDMRNYYDKIGSQRENVLRPALEQLDEILVRSAIGEMPEDWTFDFPPLWQPNASELADIENKKLDKMIKLADLGVPQEVLLKDVKEAGLSKNLTDEDVEALSKEPEFFPAEVGGEAAEAFGEAGPTETSDPNASLNGAQVTAMLDIVAAIVAGELPKDTAIKIFATAFPITEKKAGDILANVEEGEPVDPAQFEQDARNACDALPHGAVESEGGLRFRPPAGAQNAAEKALEWREKHGDEVKGMTATGWTRANQLAKRELLSLETVRRMAAFERHRKNSEVAPEHKEEPWKDNGYVAWLGWGGDPGIAWAKRASEWAKERGE